MNKKLCILGLILLLLACSIIFFACNPSPESQRTEFILTDYKTVLEITVGSQSLLFYSWYTEDMIYTYQLEDEDVKNYETYEAKIGEDWYMYEQNSFDYWTRSLSENPYDDELDIKQEDFYLDADSYYAIKPEKLEYYSDMFLDFEDVDMSGIRVKFNDDELPVEMLISIYFSDYDTYANGKMIFEYNTGETFVLPEQFVPSYNIKITSVSTYSPHVYHCYVFDNTACSFFIDSDSGLIDGTWFEVDVYGKLVMGIWYNNSWEYHDSVSPQSIGFVMINAMNLINFNDFVQEGDSLVLIPSKLSEYAPFILPNANPDTVVLSELRIKTSNGQIIEMIYSNYFQGEPEIELTTITLTFLYNVLEFEDLP